MIGNMKLLLAVLYIAFSFLEIVNSQEPLQGFCHNNIGDLRLRHNRGENFGAIQVCIDTHYKDGTSSTEWRYFSSDGAWTQAAARLACRQLNLGYLNATTSTLDLTREVYTREIGHCSCVETANQLSNCIIDNPKKITVATVNCSNGNACAVPVNEVIVTATASNCQQPTKYTTSEGDGNEMPTNNRQQQTTTESDGATTESSISQSTFMSTSGTLGALIGLLAAALVVVVTGWIVSCVYFQKKINKKYKDHTHTTSASTSDPTLQLNNPAYGVSITVPHTTYSSHGPSYEVIDTNEGAGNSYDVISHRGAARPHPHITPSVSNEEYSTLDTSRENHYHTLECNTGDGQYSMVRQTDPQNDRPDPQDYEVPAPLQGEEYSTLKH